MTLQHTQQRNVYITLRMYVCIQYKKLVSLTNTFQKLQFSMLLTCVQVIFSPFSNLFVMASKIFTYGLSKIIHYYHYIYFTFSQKYGMYYFTISKVHSITLHKYVRTVHMRIAHDISTAHHCLKDVSTHICKSFCLILVNNTTF